VTGYRPTLAVQSVFELSFFTFGAQKFINVPTKEVKLATKSLAAVLAFAAN
jgi:hypothetical protein